jgi:hypothetical protein
MTPTIRDFSLISKELKGEELKGSLLNVLREQKGHCYNMA